MRFLPQRLNNLKLIPRRLFSNTQVQNEEFTLICAPLSKERLIAWLKRRGVSYFLDHNSELGTLWPSGTIHFLHHGQRDEYLNVRCAWHRQVAIENVNYMHRFLNDWNTKHSWPSAHLRIWDDGRVQITGHINLALGSGVSDSQIHSIMEMSISTSRKLFAALEELFPDPALMERTER